MAVGSGECGAHARTGRSTQPGAGAGGSTGSVLRLGLGLVGAWGWVELEQQEHKAWVGRSMGPAWLHCTVFPMAYAQLPGLS